MKKRIIGIIAALSLGAVLLTSCDGYNKQIVDLTREYNKAIIDLGGGKIIEVDVKTWRDYDGEQLQIATSDGTVYLVSSFNCTLIKEAE